MFHFFEIGQQSVAFTGEVPDAEQRTDSGAKFEPVNGLGEEVVATGLNGFFDVAWFVEGRNDENGDHTFRWVILELRANLIAAHARHHNVQQNEVRLVLIDHLHRLLTIRSHEDLVAFFSKVGFQKLTVLLDVVGNENT